MQERYMLQIWTSALSPPLLWLLWPCCCLCKYSSTSSGLYRERVFGLIDYRQLPQGFHCCVIPTRVIAFNVRKNNSWILTLPNRVVMQDDRQKGSQTRTISSYTMKVLKILRKPWKMPFDTKGNRTFFNSNSGLSHPPRDERCSDWGKCSAIGDAP